mmetsp:Transcript_23417/g.38139  ORF Transcript_23417/g.38139 Transcript_23417/m.38139 type:complete len:203 (+) Transcript_23417:1181-1789(+)
MDLLVVQGGSVGTRFPRKTVVVAIWSKITWSSLLSLFSSSSLSWPFHSPATHPFATTSTGRTTRTPGTILVTDHDAMCVQQFVTNRIRFIEPTRLAILQSFGNQRIDRCGVDIGIVGIQITSIIVSSISLSSSSTIATATIATTTATTTTAIATSSIIRRRRKGIVVIVVVVGKFCPMVTTTTAATTATATTTTMFCHVTVA